MKYDRTVIAYHGCDSEVAEQLLAGVCFKPSENNFDWLGKGIYFWEYGHARALQFAEFQRSQGKVKQPAVVGALIQLGDCFDLLDTRFTAELATAYSLADQFYRQEGKTLPRNLGKTPDRKLRKLDCLVLNLYLQHLDEHAPRAFQTVRGAFEEGAPAFPGSMICQQTHVQIAVRDAGCVLGVFRPMMAL
jgi:hypothetical protein